MITEKYEKIQIIIEKGIDELFYDFYDKIFFGFTDDQINYLLILACDRNELDMAKYIYNKSKELDINERKYLIFKTNHIVINDTTREICLLRAITNGNLEIYEWLKSIETKIPNKKNNLYFKNACKAGNYNIIADIYNQNTELYHQYLTQGIKICLENGHFETYDYLSRLDGIEYGEWVFRNYLKSKKKSIEFFTPFEI